MTPFLRASFFASAVAAACLFLAGCSTAKTERLEMPSVERVSFWQPHLLYLQSSVHSRLYVEIDAVEGCEPSDDAVNKLREFLTSYCNKPEGAEIVRSDVIPVKEARGLPRYGLAHRFLDGPPKNAGSTPAFIYILFYDGALCDQRTVSKTSRNVPEKESERNLNAYAESLPYPAMVFMNEHYLPSAMKDNGLLHEAGHLLGLVRRPRGNSALHCPDMTCRMTQVSHLNRIYLDRMRSVFQDRFRKHYEQLCQDCVAELTSSSAAATPTNLHFIGPVLVRSEAGYHVLSLPGRVRLIVGDLIDQDCRDFASTVRGNPSPSNERYCDGQIKPSLLAESAKSLEIIHRAKRDPFDAVRKLASTFEEASEPPSSQ